MSDEPTEEDKKILAQIDGHWCDDWDGLAVSALTPEYECCVCFKKTLLGKVLNWFYWGTSMVVARQYMRQVWKFLRKM